MQPLSKQAAAMMQIQKLLEDKNPTTRHNMAFSI